MPDLDLHGHVTDEAFRAFVDFYNRQTQRGSREPIRLIHGYGSTGQGGKIRRRIRAFLETAGASLDWKTGEDAEGNPGVTIVYPRRVLPSIENQLVADILAFCSIPRTESKVAAEFRAYSAREIKQAMRTLVRQAQIKEFLKGGRTNYLNAAAPEKTDA